MGCRSQSNFKSLTKQHDDWLVRIPKQCQQSCTALRRIVGSCQDSHAMDHIRPSLQLAVRTTITSAKGIYGLRVLHVVTRASELSLRPRKSVVQANNKKSVDDVWYSNSMPRGCAIILVTYPVLHSESESARLYNVTVLHVTVSPSVHCHPTSRALQTRLSILECANPFQRYCGLYRSGSRFSKHETGMPP